MNNETTGLNKRTSIFPDFFLVFEPWVVRAQHLSKTQTRATYKANKATVENSVDDPRR